MKRSVVAFALVWVTSAWAGGIQEWRTPDGKPFFGDRPPPGSTLVKTVDKPVDRVQAPVPAAPVERSAQPLAWRDEVSCQDLTFVGVREEPFEGIPRRIVQGTVKHDGRHLVRNVRVCAAGYCKELRGGKEMTSGENEAFYLDVPSAEPASLSIVCSVRDSA